MVSSSLKIGTPFHGTAWKAQTRTTFSRLSSFRRGHVTPTGIWYVSENSVCHMKVRAKK